MSQSANLVVLSPDERIVLRSVHSYTKRMTAPPTIDDIALDLRSRMSGPLCERQRLDHVLTKLEGHGALLRAAGEAPKFAILPLCFAQGWLPNFIPLLSLDPTFPHQSLLTEVVGARLAFVVAKDDALALELEFGIRVGDVVVVGEGNGVEEGLFVNWTISITPEPCESYMVSGIVQGSFRPDKWRVSQEHRIPNARLRWRILNVIRSLEPRSAKG